MAGLPDFSADTDFNLRFYYMNQDSTSVAAESLDLSPFGQSMSSLLSFPLSYSERKLPQGLVLPTGDSSPEPYDIDLVGPIWGDDQDDARSVVNVLAKALLRGQTGDNNDASTIFPKWQYLDIELWNGSSLSKYRLYAQYRGLTATPVRKTRLFHYDVTLRFRVIDPMLYNFTPITRTITVVNSVGTDTHSTSAASRVKRVVIKVTKDSEPAADDPKDVVISNDRGQTATLTGEITTLNDYWKIDCWEGKVYKGGSFSTEVLKMDEFSGDFLSLDWATSETIDVTAPDGNRDFKVEVFYLVPNV